MKDFLLKIFNNDIMYNIIVPIVLILLGWIKNKHDLKEKNKELGYWIMKWKRFPTYVDVLYNIYIRMAISLVIMLVVMLAIYYAKGTTALYVVLGSFYFSINALITFCFYRGIKSKVEFWKNGKQKRLLTITLYIIFEMPFFIQLNNKYNFILEVIFSILLFIWALCLHKYCDVAYILDNRYADIYIRGNEKTQSAEAGSIKKYGEWIIVHRYVNGYDEEIRIRESDIVRIDYYGGPMIVLEKQKLFQKWYKY
jgi:hypothetical protein